MSRTAPRPSIAPRHTRKTTQRSDAELDQGLSIVVDGRTYTVRVGDLTAMDSSALRREVGLSFRDLMLTFTKSPDIDLVAAVVWLARRLEGETLLSYADVAEAIGYDVELDVVGVAEAEPDTKDGGLPEA